MAVDTVRARGATSVGVIGQHELPAILDVEIQSEEDDRFAHSHYATALKTLITSGQHTPPYTIGVLGPWGVGKSSIVSLCEKRLRQDDPQGIRYHVIRFNAWRFGENVKRALLRHVYLGLGGTDQAIKDKLFSSVARSRQEGQPLKAMVKDLFARAIWPFAFLFALVLLASIGGLLAAQAYGVSNAVVVVGWPILIALGALLGKAMIDLKVVPALVQTVNITEPARTSAEEYEDVLLEQVRAFRRAEGKVCERIVVFVDDLDRLSAAEMVSGLDGIRTFMNLELRGARGSSTEDFGIIFVVSCDEDRVAEALATRASSSGQALLGTIFNFSDARRYLDRVFQFRLEVRPFPPQDLRSFATTTLERHMPDLADDLRSTGHFEDVIERLIHRGVRTPRTVIQLLNLFAESWWMACQREGADGPSGIRSEAVTGNPVALAVVCALRVTFPDFYDDLLRDQDVLLGFAEVFLSNRDIDRQLGQQSDRTRAALTRYTVAADDTRQLRPEHDALQEYLSSVQGLVWPLSIQPLLLLAQDPISRQVGGDKMRQLYDALVSGLPQAVLAELGATSSNPELLDSDSVRRLRDIVEELRKESLIRQNNAAAAIAQLAARLNSPHGRPLLEDLAQRLSHMTDLRWRVGLDAMQQLLSALSVDGQRRIAQTLIDDLLRRAEPIEFRLATGAAPTIQAAAGMVRSACDLVLQVRTAVGLTEQQDQKLLLWLGERKVVIAPSQGERGSEAVLSDLVDLDRWTPTAETDEGVFLDAIGADYVESVLAALGEQSEAAQPVLSVQVRRRVHRVLSALNGKAAPATDWTWSRLARLAALCAPEAVEVAVAEADSCIEAGCSLGANVHRFCAVLGERLLRSTRALSDGQPDWQLPDPGPAIGVLVRVADAMGSLEPDALAQFRTLAIEWSDDSHRLGDEAVRMFESLDQNDSEVSAAVRDAWISQLGNQLAEPCVRRLASDISRLADAQQAAILERLRVLIRADRVSQQTALTVATFIAELPPETISNDLSIKAALDELVGVLPSRVSLADDSLILVLRSLAPVLMRLNPATAGHALHELFVGHPDGVDFRYGFLHQCMIGWWPAATKSLSDYDPQEIFDQTVLWLASPEIAEQGAILLSLNDMVAREVVAKANQHQVMEAAVSIWPRDPSAALTVFLGADEPLSPELSIQLLLPVEMGQVPSALLETACASLPAWRDSDEQTQMATLVLNGIAWGTIDKTAQFALRIWLPPEKEVRRSICLDCLLGQDLSNEQRLRLWNAIKPHAKAFGASFLADLRDGLLGLRPERVVDLLNELRLLVPEQASSTAAMEASAPDVVVETPQERPLVVEVLPPVTPLPVSDGANLPLSGVDSPDVPLATNGNIGRERRDPSERVSTQSRKGPRFPWPRLGGDASERQLRDLAPFVEHVNSVAREYTGLSRYELERLSANLRGRILTGATPEEVMPEAFAIFAEAARGVHSATYGATEILAGAVLAAGGSIAEVETNYTRCCASALALYVNALAGRGTHLACSTQWLARVRAQWIAPVLDVLGMSTGLVSRDEAAIYDAAHLEARPESGSQAVHWRTVAPAQAYRADVTCGVAAAFGFDYLSDNIAWEPAGRKQREKYYAIIDAADAILIDLGTTPLTITTPDESTASQLYAVFALVAKNLTGVLATEAENQSDVDADVIVDTTKVLVTTTDRGMDRIEEMLHRMNPNFAGSIYDPQNAQLTYFLKYALQAQFLYERDRHYIVTEQGLARLDPSTQQPSRDSPFVNGLRQAIQAKEGLYVDAETTELARIPYQNYFKLYEKLAGITDSAEHEREEYRERFGLRVVVVPTGRPATRQDRSLLVYKTEGAKFDAILDEVKQLSQSGQPVLVGFDSIDKAGLFGEALSRSGVPHIIVHGGRMYDDEREEAFKLAEAGRPGAVTLVSNTLPGGIDVLPGGSLEATLRRVLADQGLADDTATEAERAAALEVAAQRCARDADRVRMLGGIHVIGTERHQARRFDEHLKHLVPSFEPGSTCFMISLDDSLMRRFGGRSIAGLMDKLGLEDDVPLGHSWVGKASENSQVKCEAYDFDLRKHYSKFDDVFMRQEGIFYGDRERILFEENLKPLILEWVEEAIADSVAELGERPWGSRVGELVTEIGQMMPLPASSDELAAALEQLPGHAEVVDELVEIAGAAYDHKELEVDSMRLVERIWILNVMDRLWIQHLRALQELGQNVALRAPQDPERAINLYRMEAQPLFDQMQANVRADVVNAIYHLSVRQEPPATQPALPSPPDAPTDEMTPTRQSTGATGLTARHSASMVTGIGRNDPCPCGSGKKYKRCHGAELQESTLR